VSPPSGDQNRKKRPRSRGPFLLVSTDKAVTITVDAEDGDVLITAEERGRFAVQELAISAEHIPAFVHAILEVEERIKRATKKMSKRR